MSEIGKTVDVNAFTTEAGGLNEVPIVDVMIAYNCPRTSKVIFLVARNVSCVDSMENNLIPPFILGKVGILVHDIPNIHWREEMTKNVHTIQDLKSCLFKELYLYSIQGSRLMTTFELMNMSLSPLRGVFFIRIATLLQITKHPLSITGEKC